ncbi:MAG: DUF6261 family protein [Salinivirgaceae bacterium]
MIEKMIRTSRTTEVAATSTRLVEAYKSSGLTTDAYLPNMFTTLGDLTNTLTAAIRRTKVESELETKDEARDQPVRAMNLLIKANTAHPDAEIRAAALKLGKVIDKYGLKIINESFATESALINSLLGDLAAPEMQAAIALLPGCAEILASLQTAQSEFDTARVAYEAERARESTQANASELKKEVLALINDKLVQYLRAMEALNDATYGEFARTVATIIADNNIVVKKRRKGEEEEPEE